ncbi:MAG: helix-turn-helix transcriptional regulator [bacterium]|nr:helix-turn-helix transcriptional regulator [bacterium]
MQLKRELGSNIRKYRKLNNITQEKLAELIGVEINSISSIETGRYFPTPENLVKISNALQISLSELFNFQNELSEEDFISEINKNIGLIKTDKTKLSAINSFIKSIL